MTEGSRTSLETEHAALLVRLHRRSDDFEASKRLKAVLAELQRVPPAPPIVGLADSRRRRRRGK